MKNINQLKKQM